MARTASHQGGRTTPREDRESMQVRRHRQKTLEAGTSSFDASSVGSVEPPSPNARGVRKSFKASFHNFVRPASRQAVSQAASFTSLKAVEPYNDFVPEDVEAIPMNDVTALFPMRFTGLIRLKGRAAPLRCYDVLAADKLLARAKRAGMTIEYGLGDAMREGRCVGRGAPGAAWSEDRRTPSSAERSGSIESGSQYSALASIVRRGTAAIVGEGGSSRSDSAMSTCSETASQRERYLSSGLEEARRLPAAAASSDARPGRRSTSRPRGVVNGEVMRLISFSRVRSQPLTLLLTNTERQLLALCTLAVKEFNGGRLARALVILQELQNETEDITTSAFRAYAALLRRVQAEIDITRNAQADSSAVRLFDPCVIQTVK